MAAHPERYELHFQDEPHLDTTPHLVRVWHRVGPRPTLPAAGTNRRLTVFGSVEALADRADWLEVIPLARYSPHLDPKEHEWRVLTRDHRGHLAPTLREFVDTAVAGLHMLGGEHCAIIDEVPQWWLDGHRKEPTGRRPGRPMGAKDTKPRTRRGKTLPAHT